MYKHKGLRTLEKGTDEASRSELESSTEGSKSLVGESLSLPERDPEYHGTRGTPWEAGRTTFQG